MLLFLFSCKSHVEKEFSNGDKYIGEWKNGKQNGNGKMAFENGDIYIGEWKDGKYNGKGIITYFNGEKYEGEFLNSCRKWEREIYLPRWSSIRRKF
ncbi:MAG: hypothetical protein IPF63_08530 [Bacteroidetes bacterium]|nr:hypothetical protein [Bacteroidota bacterium]